MRGMDNMRRLQREWIAARRAEWFKANGPCKGCGSWERLELDHVDPATKIASNIWSWAKLKREAELEKCQPLCYACHKKKTSASRVSNPQHGRSSGYTSGCQCLPCKQYQIDRMARYHEKNPRRKRGRNSTVECDVANVDVPDSNSGVRSSGGLVQLGE